MNVQHTTKGALKSAVIVLSQKLDAANAENKALRQRAERAEFDLGVWKAAAAKLSADLNELREQETEDTNA